MLKVIRSMINGRSARSYRRAAILLLYGGRVIGEVVVLDAYDDGFGGPHVHLGISLPSDISIVRADVEPLQVEADRFVRAREQYLGASDEINDRSSNDSLSGLPPRPAPRPDSARRYRFRAPAAPPVSDSAQ